MQQEATVTQNNAVEKPKYTLAQILAQMDDFEGLDPAQIIIDLHEKIDNYKIAIDSYKARGKMFKEYADTFAKKAKACANIADNIEDRLKFAMENAPGGVAERLDGDAFKAVLSLYTKVEFVQGWENADATKALAYPDFIECKYTWDKKALNDSFKSEPEKWVGVLYPKTERKLTISAMGAQRKGKGK